MNYQAHFRQALFQEAGLKSTGAAATFRLIAGLLANCARQLDTDENRVRANRNLTK
jgi:hypothetical protein